MIPNDVESEITALIAQLIRTEGVDAAEVTINALSEATMIAGLTAGEAKDHFEQAAYIAGTFATASAEDERAGR